MARGKAISVKIATPKVIKALEAKLVELDTNYKKQDENEAKFQKSITKWNKDIAKFALDYVSKAENIRTNYRAWTNTLNVDFDLKIDEKDFPKQPERDFETIHSHTYKAMKEEIENAIRILKMTDEEVVNTSTYNAIAQYL
jgi:hypothetical protein